MSLLSRRQTILSLFLGLVFIVPMCSFASAEEKDKGKESKPGEADKEGWKALFDGKTLDNWKPTDFGGEGDVHIVDGSIVIEMGEPLSGITWKGGDIPRINYEISLEAMKTQGSDFFCGLTFPVKDSHCSLILCGWGGALTGLSSLDGFDASENETTTFHSYDKNKWYKVRVRVLENQIVAWLDDDQIVSVDTEGKRISLRIEVENCKPLSISNFATSSKIRNIKVREVKPETSAEKSPEADR